MINLFTSISVAQDNIVTKLESKYTYVYKDGDKGFDVYIGDKVGWCDINGKEIIAPTKYTYVSKYDKGFYVKIGDKAGWCDINGKETIAPTKYTYVYRSSNGYEVKIGDKEGWCDINGKEIIAPTKYTYVYKYSDGYSVNIGDKAGWCDINGKEIIAPTKYTYVSKYGDEGFDVKIGDKKGWCDINGKEIIAPTKYTYVSKILDKGYSVKIGDKAGYCDINGKEIIAPTKYTYVDKYGDEGFSVEIGDKKGWCDINGKEILTPKFPYSFIFYNEGHGFSCYTTDNRFHIYNMKQNKIADIDETRYIGMSEGLLCFPNENNLYGYMEMATGNVIIEPQYTSAEVFKDGVAKVSKGKESFLITNPLKGKSEVVSSLSVEQGKQSDIDNNIPEIKRKQENTFAVIVANQNYENFVCPFAINDGKTFKEYCLKTLGIPATNVMYYEDATLNNIHNAMGRIKDLADVYEGDAKIIFYYAGQGVTGEDKQSYLLPSDGVINLISSTGYSLQSLYGELGNLNVKSAVCLLDAGFNNENRKGENVGKNRGVAIKNKEEILKGRVVSITAASSGETALEYKDKSHGLFTYFLCKKLQETKGEISLEDLGTYIKTNVSKTSISINNKKQTPNNKASELVNLKNEKL